ncbi:hypothetical protein GCM10025858_12120 [Alicyclobacillus sacchari]|nr:hypothetical protein GCM10025858_12120 [Alicyclobacillus sacchari]
MPKDENELRHMLYTASQHDGPAAVRYPRADGLGVALDEPLQALPWGKSEVLREGADLTIIALGSMVNPAMKAAQTLAADYQIESTVVNLRFVKPLDEELIVQLGKTGRPILTVEEAALAGGARRWPNYCSITGLSSPYVAKVCPIPSWSTVGATKCCTGWDWMPRVLCRMHCSF